MQDGNAHLGRPPTIVRLILRFAKQVAFRSATKRDRSFCGATDDRNPVSLLSEHKLDLSHDLAPSASARPRKPLGRRDCDSVGYTAAEMKRITEGCRRKVSLLTGKTLANLFFENSTRTRNSFSLAAKRLGADTVEFSSSGSSVSKGETFVDTAKTIQAMGVDWVVTRHSTPARLTCLRVSLNAVS